MLTFDERLRDARMALKTGNLQAAMAGYNGLLAEQPQAAPLLFERGLVAHLGGAADLAVHDYRLCLAAEPAHLKARENLGQIARRTRPFVGPPGPRPRPATDDGAFVYAVGSSYVRSFSSSTVFLPLWLGPANELTFITDEGAARTAAHLTATLDRCDPLRPVLLVMGNNDPIVHADNLAGTKDRQAAGELGSHAEVIGEAARRYVQVLETLLERYPGIALYVLGACVMFSTEHNEFVRMTNRVLGVECARLGIPFFDINDDLTDPVTGTLRVDRASAPDNTHLSKEASVELVGAALEERGLLPAGALPFEWSFLWQAPLTPPFVVRIWGEPHTGPSNLVHSRTVAFNHVLERALHVLLGTLALEPPAARPSVLVPACREGLVPLSLPVDGLGQITGVDSDPAAVLTARRLADYFGRPEIAFRLQPPDVPLRDVAESHDYVFLALRDPSADDPRAILAQALSVSTKTVIILSTLDWSTLEPPVSGTRMIFSVADATTRPPWNAGTILIETRG